MFARPALKASVRNRERPLNLLRFLACLRPALKIPFIREVPMRQRVLLATLLAFLFSSAALAADFGKVRGVVHDPQHRPIAGATVTLRAQSSTWSASTQSDSEGEFQFAGVPVGDYTVNITAPGFSAQEQSISVVVGKSPVLHFPLEIATSRQVVEVSEQESKLKTQSSTVQTMVSTQEIARTAGADQTNSLAMITDFTPGAYMVHDMLHMRDGHQVNWFFDGIPVINTNIAVNVAPLINPKNVESLEVERGGYSSEYGDRTYGVFNVVTPSGFERNQQAELVTSYGNFHTTDDQLSFGSHTERFAYYASVDANRSDLGLTTPTSAVIHDQDSGVGGFLSLLYNASPQRPGALDRLPAQRPLRHPQRRGCPGARHSRSRPGKRLTCSDSSGFIPHPAG